MSVINHGEGTSRDIRLAENQIVMNQTRGVTLTIPAIQEVTMESVYGQKSSPKITYGNTYE